VFVIWSDESPIYSGPSLKGQFVVIPEGASGTEGNLEPRVPIINVGDFVEWVNEEIVPATVAIEPACESIRDSNTTVTSGRTEMLWRPDESFSCLFREAGEYNVHTEPWPRIQGTGRVSP
jgi:plastocyanin